MNRPTTVRVLGRPVTIKYVKGLPDYGNFYAREALIKVREGLPAVEERDTLLHEILHAVWFFMDIGKPSNEEHVVRKMSNGLTAVLQDNPELHQYLGPI